LAGIVASQGLGDIAPAAVRGAHVPGLDIKSAEVSYMAMNGFGDRGVRKPGDVASAVVSIVGASLAIIGSAFLAVDLAAGSTAEEWIGFSIYVFGLLYCLVLSAVFHFIEGPRARRVLEVLDDSGSFLLVASSWTIICLTSLRGPAGWIVFGLLWGLGTLGFLASLFVKGRTRDVAITAYYLGFTVILPLLGPIQGLLGEGSYPWLLLAGLLYAVGLLFRSRETMPYQHTIWHSFVIAASICHFFGVLAIVA
jgi:hemolysin III